MYCSNLNKNKYFIVFFYYLQKKLFKYEFLPKTYLKLH